MPKLKKPKKPRARRGLGTVGRVIILLAILALAGIGTIFYPRFFGDKTLWEARNKADQYWRTIEDCNFEDNYVLRYGHETYDTYVKSDLEKREKDFKDNCHKITETTFLELVEQPDKDKLDHTVNTFGEPLPQSQTFIAYYKVIATEYNEPMVSQLIIVNTEGDWLVTPGPGPTTLQSYEANKQKQK